MAGVCSDKEPEAMCPPENFALIQTDLYRSSMPTKKNLPYIRTLRLRTLLLLSDERTERSLKTFCEENGIALRRVAPSDAPASGGSSWKPLREEAVKDALEQLLRASNQPLLVCDVGGVHVVGMLVGCLRKLQRWNLTSIINEYRLFAAMKRRYVNELFIELFDAELVNVPTVDVVRWWRQRP